MLRRSRRLRPISLGRALRQLHGVPLESARAGIFDADALVDAVGLSAEQRERMRAYRPLWLAGDAATRQRRLPSQSLRTTEAQATHLLALLDQSPR